MEYLESHAGANDNGCGLQGGDTTVEPPLPIPVVQNEQNGAKGKVGKVGGCWDGAFWRFVDR